MNKEKTHIKVRNKGGRPTKLTDEIIDDICNYLKSGAYVETAVAACGITKETFYDWLRKGAENKDSVYGKFSDAISVAMAKAEISDLLKISIAAQKNWAAAAWRLERRHPKRWGQLKREIDEEDNEQTSITLNYSLNKKGGNEK